MLSRERRLFFLAWLKNPLRVGTPVASGRRLARAMAAQLSSVREDEYVLELGAGTGAVTRALLQSGIPPKHLIIIERNHAFLEQLKQSFPQAIVLHGDARHAKELLHQRGIQHVAAIVSSLPLLSMPDTVRQAIVHAAFAVIKPDGVFIQYTYGLLSPVPERHQHVIGIRGQVAQRVWRNFPPARVWRYTAGAVA